MINRFDQATPFQAPLLRHQQQYFTPDFKQLGESIVKRDATYTATMDMLDAVSPVAREIDVNKAKEYQTQLQSKREEIINSYLEEGGTAKGDAALRDLGTFLKKEVTDPNSRFNSFAKLKQMETDYRELRDKTFKDKAGSDDNQLYADAMYMQSFGSKDIDQFFDTKGNQIAQVGDLSQHIVPYLDIQKDLTEALNKLNEDEVYQLFGQEAGSWWLEKQTLSGISEEKIRAAATALLDTDKYEKQLSIHGYARNKNISDAKVEENIKVIQEAAKVKVDELETLSDNLNNINSATLEKKKELQQKLKDAGFYQGSIDGVVGPKTQEAITEALQQNELHIEAINSQVTSAELLRNPEERLRYATEVVKEEHITGMVNLFKSQKLGYSRDFNSAKKAMLDYGQKSQELKLLHEANVIAKQSNALILAPNQQSSETLADLEKVQKETITNGNKVYTNLLTSNNFKEFSEVASKVRRQSDGKHDSKATIKLVNLATSANYETYARAAKMAGLNDADTKKLYDVSNGAGTNANALREVAGGMGEAYSDLDRLETSKWGEAASAITNDKDAKALVDAYAKKNNISYHKALNIALGKEAPVDKKANSGVGANAAYDRNGMLISSKSTKNELSSSVKAIAKKKGFSIDPYSGAALNHHSFDIEGLNPMIQNQLSAVSQTHWKTSTPIGKPVLVSSLDLKAKVGTSVDIKPDEVASTVYKPQSANKNFNLVATHTMKNGDVITEIRRPDSQNIKTYLMPIINNALTELEGQNSSAAELQRASLLELKSDISGESKRLDFEVSTFDNSVFRPTGLTYDGRKYNAPTQNGKYQGIQLELEEGSFLAVPVTTGKDSYDKNSFILGYYSNGKFVPRDRINRDELQKLNNIQFLGDRNSHVFEFKQ